MKFPILKTKRLILREINKKDEKQIIENINNLNVSRWLLVVPYPYRKKEAKWWINHVREKKEDYQFAIELKDEKAYIGGIGLTKVDKFQGTATIGYWIGEKYWGKGYGTEALGAVLNFAFNKLKLRRVEAGVFVGNHASGKLLEKFGAKLEGIMRKAKRCKATKEIIDEQMYGILKEEFKQ